MSLAAEDQSESRPMREKGGSEMFAPPFFKLLSFIRILPRVQSIAVVLWTVMNGG